MYSSFSNVYPHTTTVVGHNRPVVVHTPVVRHRGVVPSLVTSVVGHRSVAPPLVAPVVVHRGVGVAPPVMAAHVIPSVLPSAPAHVALHNNLHAHYYEPFSGETHTCPTGGPAPRLKCSDYDHCQENSKLKKAKKINRRLRKNKITEDEAKDKCNKKGLTWIESKSKCKAYLGPHDPKCTKTHDDDYLTPHYMHPPSMYPSPIYTPSIYPPQTYPVAVMGGNCVTYRRDFPELSRIVGEHVSRGNTVVCGDDDCQVCVGNHIS
jgi:hypothetical protein